MKKIAIYGAGGLGKEVKSLIDQINGRMPSWDLVGFFDDGKLGQIVKDKPVLGGVKELNQWAEHLAVVLAIGSPKIKFQLAQKINNPNVYFPVLIHPTVIIQETASCKLGNGTIITAGCILTVDIILKEHVLINLNTTIGHDVEIGHCSSIMPGVNLAGQVKIGNHVYVGSGANIINSVKLEDACIIGSGAVVIKDVPASQTVVGVPAKAINQ